MTDMNKKGQIVSVEGSKAGSPKENLKDDKEILTTGEID